MQTKINNSLSSGSSAKLRDFAKKFERPAPPVDDSQPLPAPRDDIFERMDFANKLERDNSLDETIDVFPDVRFPLLFIIFNVMKLYKTVTEERPVLTPASLVAYCLMQMYAFALINDYYGRPQPSAPASAFMDSDARSQLFEILCKSYVPPFMLTLFHAIADCSDPRRPGLQYFCTLAGSRFDIDFGRYLPPSIFLHMHNVSTDADTSRNVPAALLSWLNFQLYNTQTANRGVYIFNYFGAGSTHNNANATHHESWLYNAVRTLFSPVTGKSLLRRTNIEYISLATCTIDTAPAADSIADASNMYIIMLNAFTSNSRHMMKFISSMSNIIKSDLKGTFQLGAVPDDLNGVQILVHGYSSFALPTWQDTHTTTLTGIATKLDDAQFATSINFHVPRHLGTARAQAFPRIDAAHADSFIAALYLQENQNLADHADPIKTLAFDPEVHVSPRCLYLDPYTSGDGPINYAVLAGLMIESEEIDGSSVPMPDNGSGLSKVNRDFLQGSVPLNRIKHGWHTDVSTTGYRPAARSRTTKMDQKISHDLYDIGQNWLGHFALTAYGPAFPRGPVGFSIKRGIRFAADMFNKLSFTTAAPVETPITIVAWSPYRYVANRDDVHPPLEHTFMLLNFRTLYGTHVPLVASRHPNVIIPIS